jgi:hypothetical protein
MLQSDMILVPWNRRGGTGWHVLGDYSLDPSLDQFR